MKTNKCSLNFLNKNKWCPQTLTFLPTLKRKAKNKVGCKILKNWGQNHVLYNVKFMMHLCIIQILKVMLMFISLKLLKWRKEWRKNIKNWTIYRSILFNELLFIPRIFILVSRVLKHCLFQFILRESFP